MNKDTSNSEDEIEQDLGTSMIRSATDPYAFQKLGELVDGFNTKTFLAICSQVDVLDRLVKLYGLGESIRNDMFLRKIARFINGCGNITEGEKAEFGRRLENDANYCKKAGENLLLILDRLDSFDKTEILGKVFAGWVRGNIDEVTFYRLAMAISNIPIGDLKTLELSYKKIATYDMKAGKPFADTLDDATSQALYNVGFLTADGSTEITYLPSELGSSLIRLMKK